MSLYYHGYYTDVTRDYVIILFRLLLLLLIRFSFSGKLIFEDLFSIWLVALLEIWNYNIIIVAYATRVTGCYWAGTVRKCLKLN